MWIIEFVNEKAVEEFESLPNDVKARMTRIIKMLETRGNTLGEPHTANLKDGFFEIRTKSSEGIARSIYCYQIGKRILILITVIKKKDKLPKSILEKAKSRLKEFENGNN
ncbi:type II toxin-antitoxin system RelE/ParE family toxin [Campylobacter sp. MIT 12-8780]|uniref:type II toxin-antitoxin system RelE/ParE family toxin n=1 Tax=unclassified Campylobacter TaxID=2593542 RepID=UPI0010F9C56D|nr:MULTISPECIES: type II toxin-antitoxin system RelE/ParE family toxin [unclassified Campylobacter]NDJ27696.1 type II toxin-antitoxin system RelE/ParE family toxin [Campylobacter sp. MIT 19-121]TKX29442.1 type II toxin-antitoxin system RelE/ParE family toxin [Campylobacter sp. MIT 12-5580]TQR40860.1 type II toxin-antitoxin system RelE/ParE family toxin [Campylobacter sp. MIT 12-8780]